MRARVWVVAASVGALIAPATLVAGPGATAATCTAFGAPAQYAGQVPTAQSVLGFELGQRDVTAAQSDAYLAAVDAASPRVQVKTLATSHQGRPLRYAIVGTPAQVAAAKAAATTLRDPATTPAVAAATAASAPAILWVAGNVHGTEESGTDASLQVLRDLADRTDCAATTITDNAVVVILPTQNPDGRELDTRRNAYGFDMNRDWFARTQPETDGKLDALAELPPLLFIDDHEMGSKTFFFPPNADPIYHEISDESVDWINNVYGAAMQGEFDRQGIPYFNYDFYDMFYMGYGDTVPTTAYLGAGMTFEKDSYASTKTRVGEQYVAQWTSLFAAGSGKSRLLGEWARSYRTAYAQGEAGQLEPNEVVEPDNTVQQPVPDLTIRNYFLRADDPAKSREVTSLVRRLQRMDVEVRRLTESLLVRDFTPYGGAPQPTLLPIGTYWIPMAQGQKHWVQAMLGEDPYTPFPYFYDVTAWSQPLLYNVAGGRSGAVLSPAAEVVDPITAEPGFGSLPADRPAVALWQMSTDTTAVESSGWLRWLLEKKWALPYRELTTKDIKAGGLTGVDVLLVPDGSSAAGEKGLGENGARAISDFVAGGGRFVGLSQGAVLASRLGLSAATFASPTSTIPGSMVRAHVDQSSPLAAGVGAEVWPYYEDDPVMTADPSTVAVSYPAFGSPDFFISGYAEDAEELGETAAVVDEPFGAGRAVLFASDPNFRAFTDGAQRILRNAVLGADPAAARAAGQASAAERRVAAEAARQVASRDGALLVTVRADAAARAGRVLASYGLTATSHRHGNRVTLQVAGFGTAEESRVSRALAPDLARLGSALVAVRMP